MPDLDVLILIADYYAVELKEILNGERKIEETVKEAEEIVLNSSGLEEKTKTIKVSHQLSWVRVIALIIFALFLIINLTDNEKINETKSFGEGTVSPEKTNHEKNTSDVKILTGIIQQQIALGASVSTDLDSGEYIWDNSGRLIRIYWNDKSLRGELSLAGLDALKDFTCCYYSQNPENKNRLTGLDISNNPALTALVCTDTEITSIDLSKAPNLVEVTLPRNSLTTLDVSKNLKLKSLSVAGNQILTLDTSKNLELLHLYCQKNNMSVLDISKNTKLEILYCQENNITTLDISKNPNLKTLQCGRTVQITGAGASIIDNSYD